MFIIYQSETDKQLLDNHDQFQLKQYFIAGNSTFNRILELGKEIAESTFTNQNKDDDTS